MPINLLKLPRLVGVSVVTELLDYREVFLLSLCSRRTSCLVKKARIRVPKLAFLLKDCDGNNEFNIGVVIDNWIRECKWLPVTSVMHVDTLALKETFTVKLGNHYGSDANFTLRSEKSGKFLNHFECAIEPMEVQKALQDHINSIFHYSETNKLYLSMKCEGSLPNVTNVKEIEIEHGTVVDPQFLTNVLRTYPDHHTLSVKSKIIGELPEDCPLFQVQNLHIEGLPDYKHNYSVPKSLCGPNYFHNFVGRNMRLDCVICTDQDLIQFLQKWISNKAYHNLKSLSMSVGSKININLVRNSVEFEEYDPNEPEKRPKDYFVDIPYVGSFYEEYPIRDQKFVEIKRITDGKRAFLDVGEHHFDFLVLKN
ncbi:unnamed protein product [Caenorhabditis nigoni]